MGEIKSPPGRNKTSKPKEDSPTELEMSLYAPGMGPLHRAGLGGLACTLKWIEKEKQLGRLAESQLPGGPWSGKPPWEISSDRIKLLFGEAEGAKEYLKRLFELAFQIRDDLIFLPGQYPDIVPNQAVRAEIQQGLTLTFLQHGQTRKLAKDPSLVTHDPDGETAQVIALEFKACSSFKHQELWENLVDKKGSLTRKPVDLDGPISPGTTQRHVAYGESKADQAPSLALPAYFAIIGTLAIAINRGSAALLIPDVVDLETFVFLRPFMTPTNVMQCVATNAADAVLQAEVRLRAHQEIARNMLPGCHTMTFRSTPWASQQKSRVDTLSIDPGDDPTMLDRFQVAFSYLKPRIAIKTEKKTVGRGKNSVTTEKKTPFRADSIIRPLVAENLALGRCWYSGFSRLLTAKDPVSGKPIRNKISYEREGLHFMTKEESLFDEAGERHLIQSVHEAIRGNFGRIREETDGKTSKGLSQASKNRMEKFREQLRLSLSGAKTEDQVRFALMDLFSRAKSKNDILRDQWQQILPIIRKNWKLARDLGLLALVSYKGASREEIPEETAPVEDSIS